MLIYIISMLLCYIFLWFSKHTENKWKKNTLILCSFLILFLVSALRYNVGTDYANYTKWFNDIQGFSFHYINFGFNAVIFFIKLFSHNAQWLFAISSLLILSCVYYAAVQNEKEYDMVLYLFVALGFYFSTLNGIRQWIAIGIFMVAYQYIIKKDFKKYTLLVLLASLFHTTAIFLIPIYFWLNAKVRDKTKIIAIILSIVLFKFINLYKLMALFLKVCLPSFYWRYIAAGVDLSKGVGSFLPFLLCVGMFIFYLLFSKKFLEKMPEELFEQKKNLSYILTIFSIMNTVNNLFSRFSLYFIPMIIFLLPDVYLIIDEKYKKYAKILIIICGVIFLTVNTLLKNSNGPLPYSWIFSNL